MIENVKEFSKRVTVLRSLH